MAGHPSFVRRQTPDPPGQPQQRSSSLQVLSAPEHPKYTEFSIKQTQYDPIPTGPGAAASSLSAVTANSTGNVYFDVLAAVKRSGSFSEQFDVKRKPV